MTGSGGRGGHEPHDFLTIWELVRGVDGWLSQEQARLLYEGARRVPPGQWIVEIGSHRGRSTIVLARAKQDHVGLLAVDPFDDPRWGGGPESLKAFEHNLRRASVEGAVQTFRGTSRQASATWRGEPIGLLYVDGAHDRRSVLCDIDGWEPFVVEGGMVCFHDAFSSIGVTLALLQRYVLSRSFRYLGSVRSLAAFRRERLGYVTAGWGTCRVLARLGYFVRNVAVKLALRAKWPSLARALGHEEPGYPY